MSLRWDELPLLPLRCVLDYLSLKDAVAAMSTCRHWRSAVLLYEGHKDTLKLSVKNIDKSMFLTRLFSKHAKNVHIYLDCNEAQLQKFMTCVFPQYFDTLDLQELLFIGPCYVQHNPHLPVVKLRRIITESLMYKHQLSIQKLAVLGCTMGAVRCENDRHIDKVVEFYSRPLSFTDNTPADTILTRCNVSLMMYSSLEHILVDYEHISTEALVTLSKLRSLQHITLNVNNKRVPLQPVDWTRVNAAFEDRLHVSVNIIGLPYRRFNEVMENVLLEEVPLASLKVMFCKTLYTPLIKHTVRVFKDTLREFVWADCPYDTREGHHRIIRPARHNETDMYNINAFILLCWQCSQLRRLVIHGYWVWHYDLVGFVRLRKSLTALEVSAVYSREGRFGSSHKGAVRVFALDTNHTDEDVDVTQINEYSQLKWKPTDWNELHPGLRAKSTPEQKADYIVQEARMPLGVTLC